MIKNLKAIIIFLVLAAFAAAMNFSFLEGPIKNSVYLASQPAQRIFWGAGIQISGFFERLSGLDSLSRQNRELKTHYEEIIAENLQLKELRKENDALREALGLELEKEFDLITADVLGKDIGEDDLVINKGADDMVEPGFPVITSKKAVLGRVAKVYKNFSKVALITNKESSFDARIVDDGIDGLAKGQGDLRLVLDFVSKDKEIKPGSVVTTSSLGGIFPKGLLAGTIGAIDKNDVETFQKAEVIPAFEINKLDSVFIVMEYKFETEGGNGSGLDAREGE